MRVVCLTEESVETLHLIGKGGLVVGVSGFARRPPEVRRLPKVCAFTTADIPKIVSLQPDLVIGFSDLQAGIAKDLIAAGLDVVVFNQRGIDGILRTVRQTAALVGAAREGERLASKLSANVERARKAARRLPLKPRVFFEEWPDPLISGIRWAEELLEAAGAEPVFPELRAKGLAKDRIVTAQAVIARDPELVLASWCGKKADLPAIRRRLAPTTAARLGLVYEVPSTLILQPGPAALTDGLEVLERRVREAAYALSKTKRVCPTTKEPPGSSVKLSAAAPSR